MSSSSPTSDNALPMVRNPLDQSAHHPTPQLWRGSPVTAAAQSGDREASSRARTYSASPAGRRVRAEEDGFGYAAPLSERDSIFATTYTTHHDNDVTSAVVSIAKHPSNDHSDAERKSPDSFDPDTKPPTPPDFNRRSTLSDLAEPQKSQDIPKELRFEGLSHGPHRNDSDLLKRVKNFEKRQHLTRVSRSQPQLAYQLHMSQNVYHEERRDDNDDSVRTSLAPPSTTEKRPNVVSSPIKGRPKQSIEATLANEDPLPNARSRKASHYLGLFKENAASAEQKKYSDQLDSNDVSAVKRDGKRRPSSPTASSIADASSSKHNDSTPQPSDHPVHTAEERRASSLLRATNRASTGNSLTHPSTRSKAYNGKESVPGEGVRLSGTNESIEWRSSTPSGGSLPLRLLEEIRSRPKLSSVDRQSDDAEYLEGAHETRSNAIKKDSIEDRPYFADSSRYNTSSVEHWGVNEEEDAEYESDKEHISSATYFPHQGPSPDDSEENLDVEQSPKIENSLAPQTIALDAAVKEILPETQRTAKSLQSKAVVRSLQQGFEPDVLRHRVGKSFHLDATSESSQSDTDNESNDGTVPSENGFSLRSAFDKGDITPTNTPRAGQSPLAADVRRAPLGAVELKPYKHQVGGHTKVFSFSKQAICKQLNNRENEFYEVIERAHPELLKFLPKYLGVLNVTYQKVARRKKKPETTSSDPPNKSHTDQANESAVDQSQPPQHKAKDKTVGGSSRSRLDPVPRAISHSQYFETQEDTIPQVVYANNMHMIPTNLFSNFPLGTTKTQLQHDYLSPFSFRPETALDRSQSSALASWSDSRLQFPQSPSWGATTVNTQLKDKVLREVFSPPVVHRRKKNGYPRRDPSQHSRISSHLPQLTYPDHSEFSPLARSLTPDIASSREPFHVAFPPPAPRRYELSVPNEDRKSALVPPSQLTEASLAKLDNLASTASESSEASHADGRVIGRRRSGGGLRRGQLDLDKGGRGNFKYYEEQNDEAESIFDMDSAEPGPVPSIRQADHGRVSGSVKSDSKPSAEASVIDNGDIDLNPYGSVLSAPLNPLQAQQQPDKHVRHFLLLEDLTANMIRPCVLDLKMGTRQYGVEANKKKQMSQRQKCKTTTSQQLGIRLCGMQVWKASRKDYVFEDKYAGRDVKPGRDFQNALKRFLCDGTTEQSVARHIPSLLEKLLRLEKIILSLPGYRFYASSLLMLYDGAYGQGQSQLDRNSGPQPTENAGKSGVSPSSDIDVRLVDFANCLTAEDKLPEGTPCPPRDRYGVDRGYIRGLRSLRTYLQRIWKEIEEGEWVERGEGEGMGLRMKGAGQGMDQPDSWEEGPEDPGDVSV